MKYKCLVLDHDDTVVNSTATIHFPCFIEYLEKKRPNISKNYDLSSYFRKNFDLGILSLLRDEIGLSDCEIEREGEYWRNYVRGHIPCAYDGIREIIDEFLTRGGTTCVVSHSYREYIERDYKHNGLKMPAVIYGWDMPADKRKPLPFAIFDIMERFGFSKSDILVVDDLKPGYDMARGAGCDFAAAGWAYDIPEIEAFMREHCDYYLPTVASLREILFN